MDKIFAGCLVISLFLIGYFGATFLEGWIAFLIYRGHHPSTWPNIGMWEWTGIAALLNIFVFPQFRRG